MVATGSKCRTCKAPAIIDLPRHNAKFCAEHFQELCRRQVAKAIEHWEMIQSGEDQDFHSDHSGTSTSAGFVRWSAAVVAKSCNERNALYLASLRMIP